MMWTPAKVHFDAGGEQRKHGRATERARRHHGGCGTAPAATVTRMEIFPGAQTPTLRFVDEVVRGRPDALRASDSFLGPTLDLWRGERVRIHVENRLLESRLNPPMPGPCPARGSITMTGGLFASTQSTQRTSPISVIRSNA